MMQQMTNNGPQLFNQQHPNIMNRLHALGVRRGHTVLLLGCGSHEMMAALAKLVGIHGHITVVDSDANALSKLQLAADDGNYVALKPFGGSHPAFDLRPSSQRLQQVPIETHLLIGHKLPFPNKLFSKVILNIDLESVPLSTRNLLTAELNRVSK